MITWLITVITGVMHTSLANSVTAIRQIWYASLFCASPAVELEEGEVDSAKFKI